MKLVAFADVHLDTPFGTMGLHSQAASWRRQELRDTVQRIQQLALEEQADALLCAGDLYEHERSTADTAGFLRATFAGLGSMPVFIAPGNHDFLAPGSLYDRTDWSANVLIFREPQFRPVPLAEGMTLWGAAHVVPAGTASFFNAFHVAGAGVHLALFHGAELGGPVQADAESQRHAPFAGSTIEAAGFHHAVVGHYHAPRDAQRHIYPGNPAPLTFGEGGERGAVVVTVHPDGRVVRTRRTVSPAQVHDIAVDISMAASQQDVRGLVTSAIAGLTGYARVTLHGDVQPAVELDISELEQAPSALRALIVRKGDLHEAYDLAALASEPTVRGQFVTSVRAALDLTEQQRQRILITGLRALDGRTDLAV